LQNASLAVSLAREFLKRQSSFQNDQELPESFVPGLEKASWPGRCQTVVDPKRPQVTWYLDGAHTVESLEYCIQWFANPGVGFPLDASGHKDDK
jgi:folylpolyglutamate synthase